MFKKIFASLVVLVIIFGVFSSLVFAKNDKKLEDIPEIDGTYDVLGHPELKVRVFVHKAKPVKPGKPEPIIPSVECMLIDPVSDSLVSAAGWKLPSNYEYNLNVNGAPSLVGLNNWPVIVEKSFNEWESALAGKVNIVRGSDATVNRKGLDGQNIVAWGIASPSALGVTYIWYYPSTGKVLELDTIMNKKFSWAWSSQENCAYSGYYDAQNILTHEIGHWFGLDDHYTADYADNTMYGYGSKTEVKKNTLTNGDIAGVMEIY